MTSGQTSESFFDRTGAKGVCQINLEDPRYNTTFLRDKVGESNRYKIFIETNNWSDEIEFDWK